MSRLLLTLFALVLLIAQGAALAQEDQGFKLTHEQIDEIGKFVHGNLAGAVVRNAEVALYTAKNTQKRWSEYSDDLVVSRAAGGDLEG